MTRKLHFIGTAAILVALSGCVSQEKYNALKLDRDGLAEQLGKAQTDVASANRELDLAKQQLAAIMNQGGNQSALVNNLMQQNGSLQAQIEELNRRYAEALNRPGGSGPLPQALSDTLSAFAAANPGLVEFDAARGIVKFKSDVTFAKGDATLQANAKDAINRFATILNSSNASGYELLIAGHTDTTPVSNPATKAAGHKDNWYLSSHRAIAVGEELMARGTNSQRIGVVGYADQRPAQPNSSAAGMAANRRVEVLILPNTVRSTNVTQRQSAPSTPARPGLNKDSNVNVPTGPAFNK